MEQRIRSRLIRDALDVWAPDWPRNVRRMQKRAVNPKQATTHLLQAEEDENDSPYISVYSFPRGHTKDGNLPTVNTLFFDMDFEDGDYVRGSGNTKAWRRDLSHLLVRVRHVAQVLEEWDTSGCWRAALSGHKGVHLFLDFPTVSTSAGSFGQFIAGIDDYADALIAQLEAETSISISDYVDVTSSDLGRLCRVPNTIHGGASASFGEPRYCVPVTIEELAEMTPSKYKGFTLSPRQVPWERREPSQNVHDVLRAHISMATPGGASTSGRSSTVNRELIKQYRENSNDSISLDDVKFLTSDRPCVWEFHKRRDKFDYGYQSHYMELFCISELTEKNVPIDVIKEFLSNSPDYDPDYTEQAIKEVISRDYNRFNLENVHENSPEFCGYDHCRVCQRVKAQ